MRPELWSSRSPAPPPRRCLVASPLRRRLPTGGALIPRRGSLGQGGRRDDKPADVAQFAEPASVRIGGMRLHAARANLAHYAQRSLDGLRRLELHPGCTLNAALEAPIRHALGTQFEEALHSQHVELRL